ncbi:MAG: exodeoxyribonuclease III, partial [Planctomycetes bacterium]|nr:exodeoxyribonuclease III [Planctomycetota bacterium]
MRIATFNCNSIRARLPAILSWLERYAPDALALQETKVRDEEFPREPIEAAGWHVVFRGEKSYNGVAVITKGRPEMATFGMGDDQGASETRLAWVKVNGVNLVNTYVPQGQSLASDKFQFKLEWLARLRLWFDRTFNPETDNIVWVGDLNVAPTALDVYDSNAIWPHVCHCQEVVDAFKQVTDFGFVDIFRQYLPDEGTFTFWDYRQRGSLSRNRG